MATDTKKRVRPSRAKPKPGTTPPAAQEFVTVERFDKLENAVGDLVTLIKEDRAARTTPPAALVGAEPVLAKIETPLEKEVRKAGTDPVQHVPRDWEEKAEEIIGDALDHCEMSYGQKGGVRFVVVIKKEKSNAPKDYLEFYGQDRRTKDIAGEGIAGVEEWCKLIRQNLNRPSINGSQN